MVLKKRNEVMILLLMLFLFLPISVISGNKYTKHKEIDFGMLSKNKKQVVAVFCIQNSNKFPIYINEANTRCGCTTVKYKKHPIFPNEKRNIYVTVNTIYLRGVFEQGVLLRLSDKTNIILKIKGCKKFK